MEGNEGGDAIHCYIDFFKNMPDNKKNNFIMESDVKKVCCFYGSTMLQGSIIFLKKMIKQPC